MKQIKWRYHVYLRKSAQGEGEPDALLESAAARLVKSYETLFYY